MISRRFLFAFVVVVVAACSRKGGDEVVKLTNAQNVGAQDLRQLKLNWSEVTSLPDSFSFPVQYFTVLSSQKSLVVDAARKSFVVDVSAKSVTQLQSWAVLKDVAASEMVIQTGVDTAWVLSPETLTWYRWMANGVDYEKAQIRISDLSPAVGSGNPEIRSPRPESVFLQFGETGFHLQRNKTAFDVKRFDGLGSAKTFSTGFSHLFRSEGESVERLLATNAPRWARQQLISLGLPPGASIAAVDLTGNSNSVELWSLATSGNKALFAGPVGSGSSVSISNTQAAASEYFTQTISPLLVRYCGGCHEGRGPVFISTGVSGKSAVFDAVVANRSKIKFRMTLPKNDARIMPQYPPFPTDAEIRTLVDWLDGFAADVPETTATTQVTPIPQPSQTPTTPIVTKTLAQLQAQYDAEMKSVFVSECVTCHANRASKLDTFQSVRAYASVASSLVAQDIMPKDQPLSSDVKTKLVDFLTSLSAYP